MARSSSVSNLRIPALLSGGVMLSYRCTNTCRHCLYRCSPQQPDEWLTPAQAQATFAALAQEPRLQGIHIAGGEPMLQPDLAVEVVRLAKAAHIPLDYMETNAFWCGNRETTREKFTRLKEAGLPAVLISVSMFHNEFVPFSRTRLCVEVAHEVFGLRGVFVYLPHIYQMLSSLPDDGTHSLEEFVQIYGLQERWEEIPELYSVIPGGRAPEALRQCYALHPAEAFREQTCQQELMSTTHFHIDHEGNLFTGLCAGVVAATVDNLHPEISEESHPIFCILSGEGPCGLLDIAKKEYGFVERAGGYVSKCDLCFDVRRHLAGRGEFEALRPSAFYSS